MAHLHDPHAQFAIDPSVDAVELKVTVEAADEDVVRAVLAREDAEPESREVYFFDTPALALFGSGIVLRARLVRDDPDDSTVKLRPFEPGKLVGAREEHPDLELEIDWVGERLLCSAKLSSEQDRGEIREVARGLLPSRRLFTSGQERFLERHASAAVPWGGLAVLGPVDVRRWQLAVDRFPYELTVEEWVLPDRSDLVELSIKVAPREAAHARERFLAFLRESEIATEGDQETKTRAALDYFARVARGGGR